MNTCYNIMSRLSSPVNRDSSGETGEVDPVPQNQQCLLTVDRNRLMQDHERKCYTQTQIQTRPQNVGSKVDYLLPPAHNSVAAEIPSQSPYTPAGYINLPKEETSFNIFGFTACQLPLGIISHDPNKINGDVNISQTAQPISLDMSLPNTKTVKNEGETAVAKRMKSIVLSHSQSPGLHVSKNNYLSPAPSYNNSHLKTSPFEHKIPTQLPHHHAHHNSPSSYSQYEAQYLPNINKELSVPPIHHRSNQSPHSPHRQFPQQSSSTQRQSPLQQHRESPHADQLSPPHQQYALPITSPVCPKLATFFSQPYPFSTTQPTPPLHNVPIINAPLEPEVSSSKLLTNQQSLVYRKPTIDIIAGKAVSQAQELRHSSLSVTSEAPLTPVPSRSSSLHPYPGHNKAVPLAFMKQPLQLGVLTTTNEDKDTPLSPKREVDETYKLNVKKRRIEEPVLSRINDTSPLLTSTTTMITTVVNTAITEDLDRLNAESSPETQAPPACHHWKTLHIPQSAFDSEKSSNHVPPLCPSPYRKYKLKKAWLYKYYGENGIDDKCVMASRRSMAVNSKVNQPPKKQQSLVYGKSSVSKAPLTPLCKLKKAWLHRYSGEADINDKFVVASGSCAILPLILPTNSVKKECESAVSASFVHNRVAITVSRENKRKTKRNRKSNKTLSKLHDQSKCQKLSSSSPNSSKECGSEKPQSAPGKKISRGHNDKISKNDIQRDGKPNSIYPALPADQGGEQPRQKVPRDEPPPVWQLKTSVESFLQDGPCYEVAPKLPKCIECRWTRHQQSRVMPNILCRFYAFRRLRCKKNGKLALAGFPDPHRDASEDDLKLWLPMPDNPPADLDLHMSRFLLSQIGDQFCDLLQQEKETTSIDISGRAVAWKRVVQGVREMCDVCTTTLFNFHWVCRECGFVVCIDCYKDRKYSTMKKWSDPGRNCDDLLWLLCTNRQPHDQSTLMLTQIIPADSLLTLGRRVHEARAKCDIPTHCGCPLAGQVKQESGILKENRSNSGSDENTERNCSVLKKILLRPSHKANGSCITSPSNILNESNGDDVRAAAKHFTTKNSDLSNVDVVEHVVQQKSPEVPGKALQLGHLFPRCNWAEKGKEPLVACTMTLTESKILYPGVPHSWLFDGQVLRLMDPNNLGNYRLFRDQWERGQPVIVSDVTKNLNMDLWHPASFARDFGETKNDLIDCQTGNLLPNQPMRRFWEGFENLSERLKDEGGNHMLLKLKDWPPGEDFAEMLPSRFDDLIKVLPLSEYTQRSGRLNLASRLPDSFVRPDLGPKIYAAYGSSAYSANGTTNMHLDSSDTMNLLVYVGIPKDSEEILKESFKEIDEAGCDIRTRKRVRKDGELPGALWHIFKAKDAGKIRSFLNKVASERGIPLEPHHDYIHDQTWYLDGPLRIRLYEEYKVKSYAIVQCLGDALFIPAGAPHQVRNLHNCIQMAEDFVSPENISQCLNLTQEFRKLSDAHSNHEDKLQIKNIIYHTVKDVLSALGAGDEKMSFTDNKHTNNIN